MKKTQIWTESEIKELVRTLRIPAKDQKTLIKFYKDYGKSILEAKYLPRRLFNRFAFLMTRLEEIRGLQYPAKDRRARPQKELYLVHSFGSQLRLRDKVYTDITIDWVYADAKDRPLVDYSESIVGYEYLNHWGVITAIQNLDQAFSKEEAYLLKGYLDGFYGSRMETKIKKVKLPHNCIDSPFSFSPSHAGYYNLALHKEKGYSLPFKVEGFFREPY